MSTLSDQVLDVLDAAKFPLFPDDILGKVTATKHASWISNVLAVLTLQGLVKLTGSGWSRTDMPRPQPESTEIKPIQNVEEQPVKTNREIVFEWVEKHPGCTAKTAQAALPDIKAVSAVLRQMGEAGRLFKSPDRPARYWVAGTQPQQYAPNTENKGASVTTLVKPASIPEKKPEAEVQLTPEAKGKLEAEHQAQAHTNDALINPVLEQLTANAGRSQDALNAYLESLGDPVLASLIDSANAANDAVIAYQKRIAQ